MKCPNCNINLIRNGSDPAGMIGCPECPFNMFPNVKKMESIFVGLSVDKNGFESILARSRGRLPLVSLDRKDIEFHLDGLVINGYNFIIAEFKRCEE